MTRVAVLPTATICLSWFSTLQAQDLVQHDPAGRASCDDTTVHSTIVSATSQAVATEVLQVATPTSPNQIPGHNTYQIILHLTGNARNIYTVFGDSRPLVVPPAYQVDAPFGSNLGPVVPALISVEPTAEYDSWLAIQPPDDLTRRLEISSVGIDFISKCDDGGQTKWSQGCSPSSSCSNVYATQDGCTAAGFDWSQGWSSEHGINTDDGAIFIMDPDTGPTSRALVAQLTIPADNQDRIVHLNAQGRSDQSRDWREYCIYVHVGGAQSGQGSHALRNTQHGSNSPPPTPAPPLQHLTACINPTYTVINGERYFGHGALRTNEPRVAVGSTVQLLCDEGSFINGVPPANSAELRCGTNGVFPRIRCLSSDSDGHDVSPQGKQSSSVRVPETSDIETCGRSWKDSGDGRGDFVPQNIQSVLRFNLQTAFPLGSRVAYECKSGNKWCTKACATPGTHTNAYTCASDGQWAPSPACGVCVSVLESCDTEHGIVPPVVPPVTPQSETSTNQCIAPDQNEQLALHLTMQPALQSYVAGARVSVSCAAGYELHTLSDYSPASMLLVCTNEGTFLNGQGVTGFPSCTAVATKPHPQPPTTIKPTPPTALLPNVPTSGGALSCNSFNDFQRIASLITAQCCDEANEHCNNGMPTSCNGGCAAILLPTQIACATFLQNAGAAMRPVYDTINEAAEKCPNACSTFDQFTSYSNQVNDACCGPQCEYLPSWTPGCQSTCTNGVPSVCTATCAQTLLPMYEACEDFMEDSGATLAFVKSSLQEAIATCSSGH
eukprot:SAG31_NODE_3936_length_3736_cov_6.504302_1_plen_780_part_00